MLHQDMAHILRTHRPRHGFGANDASCMRRTSFIKDEGTGAGHTELIAGQADKGRQELQACSPVLGLRHRKPDAFHMPMTAADDLNRACRMFTANRHQPYGP